MTKEQQPNFMETVNPIGDIVETDGAIITRKLYFEGHIPKEFFPDGMRVLYSRSGVTGELETVVTLQGVTPVAVVSVEEDITA